MYHLEQYMVLSQCNVGAPGHVDGVIFGLYLFCALRLKRLKLSIDLMCVYVKCQHLSYANLSLHDFTLGRSVCAMRSEGHWLITRHVRISVQFS